MFKEVTQTDWGSPRLVHKEFEFALLFSLGEKWWTHGSARAHALTHQHIPTCTLQNLIKIKGSFLLITLSAVHFCPHTHTITHIRTHVRAHTHTHTHVMSTGLSELWNRSMHNWSHKQHLLSFPQSFLTSVDFCSSFNGLLKSTYLYLYICIMYMQIL